MLKQVTLLLITFCSIAIQANNFLDVTQHGLEQYQDIIISNQVAQEASGKRRDCQKRYELIDSVLQQYNRPFTMLDIGAAQGYYSFRTAYDYPESVCVMIEGNNPAYPMAGSQLLSLCRANNLDNTIFLNKKIVPGDLQRLSECEHFDVVLAMNIIHWFPNNWRQVADAILNMGDNIIIETPPQEPVTTKESNRIRGEIVKYLQDNDAIVLGKIPRHTSNTETTMYYLQGKRNYLERKTWITEKKRKDLVSYSYIRTEYK